MHKLDICIGMNYGTLNKFCKWVYKHNTVLIEKIKIILRGFGMKYKIHKRKHSHNWSISRICTDEINTD